LGRPEEEPASSGIEGKLAVATSGASSITEVGSGATSEPDWHEICRRVVRDQRRLFEESPDSEERTVYEGVGEGGDHSLAIDRRCEDIVFAELERLERDGFSLTAVSEERGEVVLGGGAGPIVVIDPIDGSLNARRTIPSHSLSIAVASGPTMEDVYFAYVYDFGAREEFSAERGSGARLGESSLQARSVVPALELVGLESAKPEWIAPIVESLRGRAYRLRAVGSIAITLSWVAAGRLDGMLTARDCRSVDAAAAQLIAREAGAVVAFGDQTAAETPLSLDARYPLAAALGEEWLTLLRGVQRDAQTLD
jgi:myo-inositol-1(or 4)-monophosphatase